MSRPTLRNPTYSCFRLQDYHPLRCIFPDTSSNISKFYGYWAVPLSLATTHRISVDFFSSGYLDVSVPQVRFAYLCIQYAISTRVDGFPHSGIFGSTFVANSPKLFADLHALHRLLLPRHSPYALSFLTL